MRETARHLDPGDISHVAIVRLAWPVAVSLLSYSVMNLVDTAFVAGIGESALAGVGLGGVAALALMSFSGGLVRGINILVAQASGAGRADKVVAFTSAGALLALALGCLTALLAHAIAPLLAHAAATEEAGTYASLYLGIRIIGSPVVLLFAALREASYGTGHTRGPMIAVVIGNLSNIALDYAFVVWAEWGVAGVAWATVIANLVQLGVLWAGLPNLRARLSLDMSEIRAVWLMGLPTGIQFSLKMGALAVFTVLLSTIGEIHMAAHQIVFYLARLSFLPANALAAAASVLTGRAVGAGRAHLVRIIARRALVLAIVYTGLCTIAALVGGAGIVAAFTDDPELTALCRRLLQIAALFLIADGACTIARGVLRGTGDVRYPAVLGIIAAWALTPTAAWVLGHHLGLGAVGGWLGLAAESLLSCALLWSRLVAASRSLQRLQRAGVMGYGLLDERAAVATSAGRIPAAGCRASASHQPGGGLRRARGESLRDDR